MNLEGMTNRPEIQDLSDQIGEFIYYWGFKRIHGKIWTHLYLSTRPLDAADLIERLQISKALISITMRELLDFGVVIDSGKSAKGTQLYSTNPDILQVIMNVLRNREKRMLARIQASHDGLSRLGPDTLTQMELSPDKVKQLSDMVQNANTLIDSLIGFTPVNLERMKECFAKK